MSAIGIIIVITLAGIVWYRIRRILEQVRAIEAGSPRDRVD